MLMLLKQNILMYTKVFFKQFPLKKGGFCIFTFEHIEAKEYITVSTLPVWQKFSLLIIFANDWQGFVFDEWEQKLIRRTACVNLKMDKAEIF